MAATRPSRQWPLGNFVFSLLWGGFAIAWAFRAWSKGIFNYGRRPGTPVTAVSHPAVYWGFIVGAASAGLIAIGLGTLSLIRDHCARRQQETRVSGDVAGPPDP